jgi:hypothetical protein
VSPRRRGLERAEDPVGMRRLPLESNLEAPADAEGLCGRYGLPRCAGLELVSSGCPPAEASGLCVFRVRGASAVGVRLARHSAEWA